MVACADVDRSVSDRGAHCSCAELCRRTIYLYAVLGHSRAEKNLAVVETSRSRCRNLSGAHSAYCVLCHTRAAVRNILPFVPRPFTNQAASDTLA